MRPNEQSWLFRQGELILGPVPDNQIVQKIYAGELDGKSEVQAMGTGAFKRLSDVESFRVHLAKADAKKRVDAHAEEHATKSRKSRNRAIAITAAVLVVILGGMYAVGSYLAVHTPGKSSEELAYGDLISMEAPTISVARRSGTGEEFVEIPGMNGNKPPPTGNPNPHPTGNPNPRPNPNPNPGRGKVNEEGNDPDGMQMAKFDQGSINQVVKSYQKTLTVCLKEIYKPGVVQKIPIEFVIGNNGHVTKVWVDHPDYKTGTLPDCLLNQLQKWPFKNFEGESPTVSLSFNVGKSS
jgi:hypothetical protein